MDFYTILSYVGGGGIVSLITSLITMKYAKKTSKLDYTERMTAFYNKENEGMIARVDKLEEQIKELYDMSCIREKCTLRKKAI